MRFLGRETLIERLARQAGWLVTEREGDYHQLRADDGSPLQYINVRCRDDKGYVSFWTVFPVRFPYASVTMDLFMGLLIRNRELKYCKWCSEMLGSCEISISLSYIVPKAGLCPASFDAICREMTDEIQALRAVLRGQLANMGAAMRPAGSPFPHPPAGRGMVLPADQGIRYLK